jgi:hypothetical protein
LIVAADAGNSWAMSPRRLRILAVLPAALLAALLSACSSEDPAPLGSGRDAATDSAADTATDSATDSAADTATGPDTATAPDTATGPDAPPDAVTDAADAPDAATAAVPRIEELYSDRFLNGDKVDFVEITAPPGTPLDNLSLRLIDGTGKVTGDMRVAGTSVTMPSGGVWVVGASCVGSSVCPSHVDQTYSITTWGLASDLGAVQLLLDDGSGTRKLLDVVGWGGTPSAPSTAPTTTVEGTPAPISDAAGHSIGRRPGAANGHDNGKDFCRMAESPGGPNGACL